MKVDKLLLSLALLIFVVCFTSCENESDLEVEQNKEARKAPYKFVEGFKDNVEHPLANGITGTNWMSKLDDNEPVCHLSIPGTHDALTGMGFYNDNLQYIFNQTAISQVSTLNQQLESGIRFFDIRPVVSIDTISHKKILRCTHGISEINVTFEEALNMLARFLRQNPKEFVIVKLQHDNGVENQVDWSNIIRDFLYDYNTHTHPGIFASWRPDITVGEMRGKILFINRKKFDGMYGAQCEWPDEDPDIDEAIHPEEEKSRRLVDAYDPTLSTSMYVQDYYKTTNDTRQQRKTQAVLNMLAEARICTANPTDNTWIVNHCSAYTQVSPRGYVTNASIVHPAVIQDILAHPKDRVGIIAMDFSCYDNISCVINGYTPYTSDFLYDKKPMSQSLTNLIIMSNF